MKILFLDIDGVLNGHEWDAEIGSTVIDSDKVHRLNRVLRETGCRVVISSAWRYLVWRGDMTLTGLDWLLRSHGVLGDRLQGVTRPDTMIGTRPAPNERGRQISDWLNDYHDATAVAVVDDLDLGIRAAGHQLVQTDTNAGLTDADADSLVRLLNGAT